jgi:hypothetical protein
VNINRWVAIAGLALGLHTQAQTPTPAPAPAQTTAPATPSQPVSGPTMEQTIAFINDAFRKTASFEFAPEKANPSGTTGWNKKCASQATYTQHFFLIRKQSTSFSVPSTLNMVSEGAHIIVTDAPTLDKNGCAKANAAGETLTRSSVSTETGVKSEVPLDALDPLSISIDLAPGDSRPILVGADDKPTSPYQVFPELFLLTVKQKPANGLGSPVSVTLGWFYDKPLAERVAKAFIHAIVLCHKPDAPSLF